MNETSSNDNNVEQQKVSSHRQPYQQLVHELYACSEQVMPCHHNEQNESRVPESAVDAMHVFKHCLEGHMMAATFDLIRKGEKEIEELGSQLADEHAAMTERSHEQMTRIQRFYQYGRGVLNKVGAVSMSGESNSQQYNETRERKGDFGESPGSGIREETAIDDEEMIRAAEAAEANRKAKGVEKNDSMGSRSSNSINENGHGNTVAKNGGLQARGHA